MPRPFSFYLNLKYLFVITLFCQIVSAQPGNLWEHYYEGPREDYGSLRDVFKTEDGFALTGTTGNFNGELDPFSLFWLILTNENGNVLNQFIYRPQEWRIGVSYSVIQCDDSGFLMGGIQNSGSDRFTVIRTNDDGDLMWNMVMGDITRCYAVIELKDGNYVGCGRNFENGTYNCYAVKFDDDGDVIWEESYNGYRFWATKEIDNGHIFAGHRRGGALIVRTDENGESVWERTYGRATLRDLISCRDGGFAATGGGNRHYLLRINDNGDRLWERFYNVGGEANGLAEMSDGGFIIAGSNRGAELIGTDEEGNMAWHRNDNGGDRNRRYYSIVAGEDGFAWAAGYSRNSGYLVKILPMRSAPVITDFTPESQNLSLLLGDSQLFSVSAVDWQEDSLSYLWTLNGISISSDTSTAITFDELGIDTVQCTVSDSALGDSTRWIVHVVELYIDSHSPQTLTLPIRRNNSINFTITTRAIEDDPVEYQWLLNDEQIAENDSVSIRFERGREHSVTAIASQGVLADSVTWQVLVNDLIVDYMPEQLELSVEVDTTFEFEVFPFDPEDDSLNFLWTLDGDSISDNSWVLVNFDSIGQYNVTAYVSDTTEADSLTWEVNVTPNSVYSNEPKHPDTPTLYPPVPNPFNSRTKIRFFLPAAGHIRLNLFDINGRLVKALFDSYSTAGEYVVDIKGNNLTTGVYFIQFNTGGTNLFTKALLIK